jgi:chemotaxis protein methyltransferase CheR
VTRYARPGRDSAAAATLDPWPGSDAVRPLTAQEFDQIRDLAHKTFGLDLKPGKEELVSARLRRLVRECGFQSFHAYYRHIVADETGVALAAMIDALTTNHTAFLREAEHFEFLQAEVLPHLRDRNPLEIWCGASSTGEEVWTLACLLHDALPSRRFHVTGTDISNRALRFAERAVYPADRCQTVPRAWRDRYFEPADSPSPGAWRVAAAVRMHASFRRINLVEPLSWPRPFPVIFCRNVMIYFDAATQEKVVRQLSDSLEPGGYLFVGHAESLTRIPHSLEYVRPAVYRKPAAGRSRWRK